MRLLVIAFLVMGNAFAQGLTNEELSKRVEILADEIS